MRGGFGKTAEGSGERLILEESEGRNRHASVLLFCSVFVQ